MQVSINELAQHLVAKSSFCYIFGAKVVYLANRMETRTDKTTIATLAILITANTIIESLVSLTSVYLKRLDNQGVQQGKQ